MSPTNESACFFVIDEPHAVPPAVVDGLAACGYAISRGAWADAKAALANGSAGLFVVNWTLGATAVASFVREASLVPVATVVLRDDDSTLAAALRSGCAAAWSVPLDSRFVDSVEMVAARALEVARLSGLVRDLGALSEDYLKRLVAVEHELFDLRGETGVDESPIPEAKRILVVDDEPVIVALLSEALASAGFDVDRAGSAEEATSRFHARPAAIVLTDKNLPGKSGLDLLRELRSTAPNTAVLLMTGYASLSSAVEAMNLGAAGYITKPFGSLEDVIRQVDGIAEGVARKMKAGRVFRVFMERNQTLIERMRALRVGRADGSAA
ncbi:MAG: response regulator [Deltaproteobacteria bacterium]|nr:response regulator [Deltaproteobacteria bacterium]